MMPKNQLDETQSVAVLRGGRTGCAVPKNIKKKRLCSDLSLVKTCVGGPHRLLRQAKVGAYPRSCKLIAKEVFFGSQGMVVLSLSDISVKWEAWNRILSGCTFLSESALVKLGASSSQFLSALSGYPILV